MATPMTDPRCFFSNVVKFGQWEIDEIVRYLPDKKMAEPIKMPFGRLRWVGPRNHVLDGIQVPHGKGYV